MSTYHSDTLKLKPQLRAKGSPGGVRPYFACSIYGWGAIYPPITKRINQIIIKP